MKETRLNILQTRAKIIKGWSKKLKGKNISEICRKAKISRPTLYSSIKGLTMPSEGTFNKINKILNPDE